MRETPHRMPLPQQLPNHLLADAPCRTRHGNAHHNLPVLVISCWGSKPTVWHLEGEIIGITARHVFMRAVDRLTQAAFHLSGGRIGGRQLKYTILLLETRGRTSGKTRTHALLYVRDGERYVVCGSSFGAPRHPAWYWNLRAEPRIQIQVRRNRLKVLASIATGDERERLWQSLLRSWPSYASYQAHIQRQIPVVILTPLPGESIS